MKVAFKDVDQQSVDGRTARAVNRTTGEVHTVTIAGGEADFGQLTYQQAYEVYGVSASGARVTQVLVKTETTEPATAPQDAPSLSATVVSDTRIDLTIGSVSGATGYEYRVDGGTPVAVGTNRTPQVTGLTAETQYSFEARAYNAEGAGPWSSVVQATTQAAGSGTVYTTDFTEYDANEQPYNWSQPWVQTTWNVVDDATLGRVLVCPPQDSSGRYVLSSDVVGVVDKVKIIMRFRGNLDFGNISDARPALRIQGAAGTETGYLFGWSSVGDDGHRLTRYENGDLSSVTTPTLPLKDVPTDTWAYVWTEIDGNTLRQKIWLEGESVPETWVTYTDPDPLGATGLVGIARTSRYGDLYCNHISIATGDAEPEMPS